MRRTDFSSCATFSMNGIEIGADEQQFRAGILDDIGHLGRRQPEIDRHQHHIGFGGAEPEFEKSRRVF